MSVIDRLGSLVPSPTATEPDHPGLEIETDNALSLLANERRRLTIRYAIEEAEDVFDLNDVVEYIATHENGAEYTPSERKCVYIALYQTHLDKLVDAGVLERVDDAEAHTFQIGEAARPLYDVLEATSARLGGDV